MSVSHLGVSTIGLAAILLVACQPEPKPKPKKGMDSRIITDSFGAVQPLLCPGATGCEKASGDLLVGVAREPITPQFEPWEDDDGNGVQNDGETFTDLNGNQIWDPVWLAGFAPGRAATGINDDNLASVMTFRQGDVSVAIVSLDLIGFFHGDAIRIRRAAQTAGLDFDHIVVASTHQHEGKDTMGQWGRVFAETGYDDSYIEYIVAQTVLALGRAQHDERAATMRVALGSAPELVRDSRLPEVLDQNIYSVAFDDAGGVQFATLVVWGNHPETLGSDNTLLTSDYPHYLRQEIEQQKPETTAVFFSGILGGLTTSIGLRLCPDGSGGDTCPQGTFERAQVVGQGAARTALAALEGDGVTTESKPELAFRRQPLFMSMSNIGLIALFQWGVYQRRIFDLEHHPYQQEQLDNVLVEEWLSGDYLLHTEVNALTVGPIEIATVPAEIYAELWLAKEDGSSYIEHPEGADYPDATAEDPIQNAMPTDRIKIIFNQCNDSLGYVIPKSQYDAVEPFAYEDDGQYGEVNSLGYDSAPSIIGAIWEMYDLKL